MLEVAILGSDGLGKIVEVDEEEVGSYDGAHSARRVIVVRG